METKTDILREISLLSPLIAALNKVNVFTVPEGYFDSLSKTVLACLQEENNELTETDNTNFAGVPEGYFDDLAANVLNKIRALETALDELRILSPLLFAIPRKNVFELPVGYFESMEGVIIEKIRTVHHKEELKAISPILYNIQSKAVFEVPNGYFTDLPGNILTKVLPRPAKVFGMHKRSLFVKYAVAAMMTGVMALGVYKYFDKPFSADTIENNSIAVTLDAPIEKGKSMNDKQFNEALDKLTEADIAKYLENNGDIADVAVLRNNLEEANLPSQEDYLLDETTLENYLKEIENTTLNN